MSNPMTLQYETDPHSPINTERWLYQLRLCQWRYANRGYGCKSAAASALNRQRGRLRRMAHEMAGRPVMSREMSDFDSTVAGIPCGVYVTHYSAQRINTWGHPDDQLPDDPAEVEFEILDRRGYEAPWLRAKASMADLDRIAREAITLIEREGRYQ